MRILSKLTLVLSTLLLALTFSGCGSKLTIVFPSLGSADCAILLTEHTTVVIDTGETGDAEEILDTLAAYQRSTVDLLLISHYDKDHVGGAAELLESVSVQRVIGSTSPKNSSEYSAYQAALQSCGLTEEIPGSVMTVDLDGLELTVYPPQQETYSENQSNNSSTVVSAAYGNTHFLFTGDAMEERAEELLPVLQENGIVYNLIKVPHHGRDQETTQDIFGVAGNSDTISIVTSSKKEPENEALMDVLPNVYLTRKGAVTVISDGSEITVEQD
jgi:beta-lactamase superfamily II metal-dependent hydrolase